METIIFGLTIEDMMKLFVITVVCSLGVIIFIFMLFAIREHNDSDYTKYLEDDD